MKKNNLKIVRLKALAILWFALLLIAMGCSSEEAEPVQPAIPVSPEPSITQIEPDRGKFGDAITITGLNFGGTVAENKVTFNGMDAAITEASATRLVAEVPKGAGSGPVLVTTKDGTSRSQNYTYILRAVVQTVAGTGFSGFKDGAGGQAQFHTPKGLFMNSDGALLIADAGNHSVRKLVGGNVSTLVFAEGHAVNDVLIGKRIDRPSEIFIATVPDVNHLILGGFVFAGNVETQKFREFQPVVSEIDRFIPGGITISPSGQLFITDWGNQLILRALPRAGFLEEAGARLKFGHMDGRGENVRLNKPTYIRSVRNIRGNDQLYFIDEGNHSIRTTEDAGFKGENLTSTVAGNGRPGFVDGRGNQAQLDRPKGLDLDDEGNVYVADFGNNAIRKITPDGEVTTILKSQGEVSAIAEPQLIDGPEGVARFNGPFGIAVAADGSLFVSDLFHHAIRRITFE